MNEFFQTWLVGAGWWAMMIVSGAILALIWWCANKVAERHPAAAEMVKDAWSYTWRVALFLVMVIFLPHMCGVIFTS